MKNGKDFRGVFPPMVTPLSGHDKLDIEGTEKLTDHILAGKVQGRRTTAEFDPPIELPAGDFERTLR